MVQFQSCQLILGNICLLLVAVLQAQEFALKGLLQTTAFTVGEFGIRIQAFLNMDAFLSK